MFDFLDKLREKPEAYRFRLVILSAVTLTGIILFIYISIQFVKIDDSSKKVVEEDIQSPFSSIQSGVAGFLKEGKSKIDELRDIAAPFIEGR